MRRAGNLAATPGAKSQVGPGGMYAPKLLKQPLSGITPF
jgi:hypothetical protein